MKLALKLKCLPASASPSDKVEYFTWLDWWQTSSLAFVVQSIHDTLQDVER
jgi:hypothetical protein